MGFDGPKEGGVSEMGDRNPEKYPTHDSHNNSLESKNDRPDVAGIMIEP